MLTIGSDNGCEPARKQAIFSKEFDHALCVHMVIEPQCVEMNVHYVNNYVTITVRSVERISASIPIARDLLFTRYITKSRSNEIAWENRNIALKFCMRLGSSATETPVKFHSNWKGKLQSRCFEILYDLATSYYLLNIQAVLCNRACWLMIQWSWPDMTARLMSIPLGAIST